MSSTNAGMSQGGLQLQLAGGMFYCQEVESPQEEEGIIEVETVDEDMSLVSAGSYTSVDDSSIITMFP